MKTTSRVVVAVGAVVVLGVSLSTVDAAAQASRQQRPGTAAVLRQRDSVIATVSSPVRSPYGMEVHINRGYLDGVRHHMEGYFLSGTTETRLFPGARSNAVRIYKVESHLSRAMVINSPNPNAERILANPRVRLLGDTGTRTTYAGQFQDTRQLPVLNASVSDVQRSGNTITIRLDKGSYDGVVVGRTGHFMAGTNDNRLTRQSSDFRITAVEANSSRATVSGVSYEDVRTHARGRLPRYSPTNNERRTLEQQNAAR